MASVTGRNDVNHAFLAFDTKECSVLGSGRLRCLHPCDYAPRLDLIMTNMCFGGNHVTVKHKEWVLVDLFCQGKAQMVHGILQPVHSGSTSLFYLSEKARIRSCYYHEVLVVMMTLATIASDISVLQIKLDPSFQPKNGTNNNNSTISHHHPHHQQAAASGISDSSPADYTADVAEATEEAGGETDHPVTQNASPREAGSKHLDHNRTSAQTDQGPHGGHPTTAGGATPADLQEGEAGESTPNLAGSSRVPAGHMDHGLPAEGLRMHSDGNAVTEGVTEAVTGNAVSGRAAHNAANASQALNKKVSAPYILFLAHVFT